MLKNKKKPLTEKELLYYLENDAESDIPDMTDEEDDCNRDDAGNQSIADDVILEILTSQFEEDEDLSDHEEPDNLQEKPDGELLKKKTFKIFKNSTD